MQLPYPLSFYYEREEYDLLMKQIDTYKKEGITITFYAAALRITLAQTDLYHGQILSKKDLLTLGETLFQGLDEEKQFVVKEYKPS